MYGAGNIGRGFIGARFSAAGYRVGFVDINMELIDALNARGSYPVDVVTSQEQRELTVGNVYGIDGRDNDLVAGEIASADAMATAIGVNVLRFIAKPIAMGLARRAATGRPLNIIICENMLGADSYLRGLILKEIPELADYVNEKVGFVEASIGRMVPVVTEEKRLGDPLRVYVEPYDILPVDKDAFRGEIPDDVPGLYPYAPFGLFIERKLFIHNMSHALCAYLGALRGYEYVWQAAGDYDIRYCALAAITSSAAAVAAENGGDMAMIVAHGKDLLYRFTNTALGDTVARVGRDTRRKLGPSDRLIGALRLCEKHGVEASYICIGVAAGLLFAPEGDESSAEVSAFAASDGVPAALEKYSEYSGSYVSLIAEIYAALRGGASLIDVMKDIDERCGKTITV